MNERFTPDDMSRPALYTIAPQAPFLDTLARRVLDGTLTGDWPRDTPFWLSDVTIILPTRRAVPALAAAFARAQGGAVFLPDIRTLGGEAEDEEPFLPPFDAPEGLPAIANQHRRLILAKLVEGWIETQDPQPFTTPTHTSFASPPSPAEILTLADSLGELIDEMAIDNIETHAVQQVPTEGLSAYSQQTLKFLDIALTAWPKILKERGRLDATSARNARLRRQAETAELIFGDRPVIAAGSTGSIPATADLMKAIAKLPRGALVLPGLDTSLDADAFAALLDPQNLLHGNPQYGLARLIRHLGVAPGHVDELAAKDSVRTQIVRQALKPAEATAAWPATREAIGDRAARKAMARVSILAGRTEEDEARAVAVAARHGLASGSVGIVSPDRNLARRIAAELMRFGIEIDDSAGTPLFQSRAGRLARQVLRVAASGWAAVDLMALLRGRSAGFGLTRAEVTATADLIEMALLRGQRPAPGAEGLRATLAVNLAGETGRRFVLKLTKDQAKRIDDLIERIEAALAPLSDLLALPAFDARGLAAALAQSVTAITEGIETRPMGMAEFERWADELVADGVPAGPALYAAGLDEALQALMAGVSVRAPLPERPDIAIWGQLEARLQNPDLLILAGVNEGIWPEDADPGPWLSRTMRIAAGLQPPEWRQGLAAHDFEMALGNGNVLIAFAERVGTSPATPSRLVQRLEAFLKPEIAEEMCARGEVWLAHARALDAAGDPQPATRPLPCPPASRRTPRLSVTEIERLIRSPYDLYAKYTLGLRPLDPLGEEPGSRERGIIIHGILGRFVQEGHDPTALSAEAVLIELAREAFAGLDWMQARRDIWERRFSVVARKFLDFERARDAGVASRHAELRGEAPFVVAGEKITLVGQADRVDVLTNGKLEILDFKTGGIPGTGEMQALLAPQLPAEALIARAGGFDGIAPAEAAALAYIKLGAGPEAFEETGYRAGEDRDVTVEVDVLERRLQAQVAAFLLSDTQPMTASIFPKTGLRYREAYEHLARAAEWSGEGGGSEE